MCGRYRLDPRQGTQKLLEMFAMINRMTNAPILLADVSPASLAPVISSEGASMMHWGLPAVAGRPVINARAETAFIKPMFRDSMLVRRLIVPTTGFYEWSHINGKPVDKYLFNASDDNILYLAGLWQPCTLPSGEMCNCFAILTTEANDSISTHHDRMPVSLQENEWDSWLQNVEFAKEVLSRPQRNLMKMPMGNEQLSWF